MNITADRWVVGWPKATVAALALLAFLIGGVAAEALPRQKSSRPVPAPAAQQGPYLVVVSIGTQRLTLYDKLGRVLDGPVSSGQPGYDTPQGVFAIIERNREHFSNLYDAAPMPNMQRITWSGVAMHAGHLPGYSASHGCIRLPYDLSAQLFELTRLGTRVVVTDGDVAPVAFDHPRLFTVRSNDAPAMVAEAGSATRSDADLGRPMMLGAASISPAQISLLPPVADLFADRPAGKSKAAWAAELTARVVPLDAVARSTRVKALAATRNAEVAMRQVLATERARSNIAARIEALEAVIVGDSRRRVIVKAEQAKAAAEARLAELLPVIERLREIEEERRILAQQLMKEAEAANEVRNAAGALARDANRSMKPVSVFVSRRTGRLYVRQGFQPLFDAPVEISNPIAPIGTHVYTALEPRTGGSEMRWSAVTVVGATTEAPPAEPVKGGRHKQPQANLISRPGQTATAALDRIDIPDEVRQRIGEMLIPGSSLIISDEGVSNETGKGTDFVILTK
jgi:hypothetical protein